MFKSKFKQKILLYLTLTILVQVSWIAFVFSRDVMDYTDQYNKDIVEAAVTAQVELFNDWVEIQESIIENYAISFSRLASEPTQLKEMNTFIDVFASQEKDFLNVYYTSEAGLDLLSGGQTPKVDGRTRDWYKGAQKQGFFVSKPYIDAITNQFVVTLSIEVRDINGHFLGVLGADLLLKDLFNMIEVENTDLIAGSFITDEKGQIIFYEGSGKEEESSGEKGSYENQLEELKTHNESIRIHLGNLKSDIIIFFENNTVMSQMTKYSQEFWLSIATGLIGLFLVAIYLAKVLSNPITKLTQLIKKLTVHTEGLDISREKFDEDLEEILQLFVALDNHIEGNSLQINAMNDNMKEANSILEKKNEEFQNSLNALKTANNNLSELERTYQNLINNIDDLIWIVDMEGRITYANTRFNEMISNHYETDKVLYLKDIILEVQEAQRFSGVGIFGKRDYVDIELKFILPDQHRTIDIQGSTAIIYLKDAPVSVQFICRDVTEEKKLYSQYYHKNREMMILNDISRSLTMKEDLKSILQLITDRICSLLSVSAVSVRMLDSEEQLVLAAYSGVSTKIYPQIPKLNTTHMGLSLKEERIICIKDQSDLCLEDTYLESVIDWVDSIYYFPLYNHENKFGVLTVITNDSLENDKIRLLKSLSENASTAIEKATLFERLRNNYLMTIEALSNALEEKVFNYKNHTKRVAEYSRLIAERFYLSRKDLDDIYISGLLHDIGKLGVADEILNHKDMLSEQEAELMMKHVDVGKKIIDPIGLNQQIVEGIYLHHKNYDLTGYPKEVELDRLPLFARIIGVADAFDSEMIAVNKNPSWRLELVYNQLEIHKETLYCPEVMAALWELIKENREQVLQISEI